MFFYPLNANSSMDAHLRSCQFYVWICPVEARLLPPPLPDQPYTGASTLSYAIGGGNNRLHPFWKRWIWIWILLYLSFSRLAAARTSKLIMSFGGSKLEVLANCPIAARRKVVTPYHHVSLAIFISAVPHSHRVMLLLTFFNYSNRSWRLAITIGLKVCMCSVLMFPLLSWVWHPVFSVSSL